MRVPTMVHNGAQTLKRPDGLRHPAETPQPTIQHEVMSMESIARHARTLYAAQYAIDWTDGIKTEIEILFFAHPMDSPERVRDINQQLAAATSVANWTFQGLREMASVREMRRALTN